MLSFSHHLKIFAFALAVSLLSAQCNTSSPPPLPATPEGPNLGIALLSPNSGEMATFGRMARNGSIMVFDEWNQQGGVLGRHIEWTIYDTNCDLDTARRAAQQAIADGYTFIIGPTCSEAAIGAATIAETEQVLMISPTATHPLVTVNGQGQTRPLIFRAAYAWPRQAQAAAQFAFEDLQATQAAILTTPNDDYGETLANAFRQAFTMQGGEIVWQGSTTSDDPILPDKLTAIEQAGATIIYLPAEAAVANQIGNQLNTMGINDITLIGSDSWEAAALDRAVTNGSYFTTHFTTENPAGREWANTYKSGFAIEPNTLAALGYDAASLLLNAIEQANSVDPATVAKTLETQDFAGITGPIKFDDQHNPAKPVPIIYINEGITTFIKTIAP